MFKIDDETGEAVISRKVKNKDAKCHIGLLRIDEDDIDVFTKDFSNLLNSQRSKFHNRSCFWKYCHNGFGTQKLLKKHYGKGRLEVEGQQVEIPTPAEKLKCKHHFKKLRRPFDFFRWFWINSRNWRTRRWKHYIRPKIIKSINHAASCYT